MIREWLRLVVSQTMAAYSREGRGRGGAMDDLTAGNYNASGLA